MLTAPKDKIIQVVEDYKNYPKYLPGYLESVEIIEQGKDYQITQVVMLFNSLFKKTFTLKAIHKKLPNDVLLTEVISGFAKGSVVKAKFESIDNSTKVTTTIELNLSLKTIILKSLIKIWYKSVLTMLLYKINNVALDYHETLAEKN